MAEYLHVLEKNDVQSGFMRRVELDDRALVIIRIDDQYYALEDRCSHEEIPLSEGWIEEDAVACCMHGAKFNPKTGDPLSLPAYEPVKTYPVKVIGDSVKVNLG